MKETIDDKIKGLKLIKNSIKEDIGTIKITKKTYLTLTEEEEETLRKMAIDYLEKYKMDIVLVTIKENPYGVSDEYTKIYSQDFYDYNGFGVGETKDGIIVLIDMANRYPYITTTGEAILMYDDDRIEDIHDYAYEDLADGNYFAAFKKGISNTYVLKIPLSPLFIYITLKSYPYALS